MDRKCSDLSAACMLETDHPVCAKKSDGFTTGGSRYSTKQHRSLNGLARHEKIILPPLPPVSIPGHKKQNSSPTSITDWDAKDCLGSLDISVSKEPDMIGSLEIIFSPRHLVPTRRQVTSSQRRCPSPSDFLGTQCACSILKEHFSLRFRQEKLLSKASTLASTL